MPLLLVLAQLLLVDMYANLQNPKTDSYLLLKNLLLGDKLPWYSSHWATEVSAGVDDFILFFHNFVERPDGENKPQVPVIASDWFGLAYQVFEELCETNNIKLGCLLRLTANNVFPNSLYDYSPSHVDHPFDHSNMIITFTSTGGSTFVEDIDLQNGEDSVVMFGGNKHYHSFPSSGRRIVMVATFIEVR